jgi:hypothetical protein
MNELKREEEKKKKRKENRCIYNVTTRKPRDIYIQTIYNSIESLVLFKNKTKKKHFSDVC